jgi:hypothetical protein
MQCAHKIDVGDFGPQVGNDAGREVLHIRQPKQSWFRIHAQTCRACRERFAHTLDHQFMLASILRTRKERLAEQSVCHAIHSSRPRTGNGFASRRSPTPRHQSLGRDAKEGLTFTSFNKESKSAQFTRRKPR